ncbi:helicase-associated domain-containing protein [Microcella sp.]|uniref:helicase-associated domain-containing protein n=1 Tax=Microcella sp. TaxID=1913979 RepID=UPI00391D5ABB
MPAASPASLALAARLRQYDEAGLAELIRRRRVSPASLDDLFDLAEALLDDASIASAVADMHRASLAAVATAVELDPEGRGVPLSSLASRLHLPVDAVVAALDSAAERLIVILDDAQVLVPSAVGEALARRGGDAGELSAAALRDAPAPSPLRPVDPDDIARLNRIAAEHAFEFTVRLGELTRSLERTPARLLARGGVSLPDARRVAADAAIADETLGDHLALARSAQLVADTADELVATPLAERWRSQSLSERWRALAESWSSELPTPLRAELHRRAVAGAGDRTAELVAWLYPAADAQLRERLEALGRQAALLGVTVDGRASSIGAALLSAGGRAAADALAPHLPPEVRQVYLQHDLTIVSPGPLAAELDERLRGVADVEAAGLAGRYRLTADSVTRAIARGESAQTLTDFLTALSLTGVPQPVAYLIDETARRYGAVRVGMLAPDEATDLAATTSIRSDDPALIDTLRVDAALTPLGLTRTGPHRLVSRLDPSLVLGTLIDARYPAAPEEGEHPIVPARAERRRGRAPAPRSATTAPTDPVLEAARRLHSATSSAGAAGGDAWVARQWELALRAKLPVHVTVRLPDGTERAFDLEPTGIAAGRVRGRDLAADVERTLPISSIAALDVPE